MANPQGVWARAIRRHLKRMGLTQSDLARLIDENPSRISDWVRGRREPSDASKIKLVKKLSIPAHEITPEWLRVAVQDDEVAA